MEIFILVRGIGADVRFTTTASTSTATPLRLAIGASISRIGRGRRAARRCAFQRRHVRMLRRFGM